ncbi:FAD-dependent oxidoreductase [Methanocaldococcus sp. FS406-22]|uniref:FAD-dependent oxidoreductase n=1 Tax=Methanocaldococcus sp. (strain FS406-22) TaxID=644281 RepID=UPI00064FD137|nr:FAD-dependent oxidoreductase [Methanocaldococcus sp. FS406-22]
MDYDVIIVGAGPAGLFAAYELAEKSKLKILIIEKGKDIEDRKCPMLKTGKCLKCPTCNIMYGVGGAGGLSDGTLNLRPDIGGNLAELVNDENYAWQLVYEVDKIFLRFGAPREVYKGDEEEVKKLEKKAAQVGIKFIPIIQRHIGSDNTPRVIKNIKQHLENDILSALKGGVSLGEQRV